MLLNPPLVDDGERTMYGTSVYDLQKEGGGIWAHVYYSPSVETTRKERFVRECAERKRVLREGSENVFHRKFYDEYFTITTRGCGGKPYVADKRNLSDIVGGMDFGYWVLYTDMEKDANVEF